MIRDHRVIRVCTICQVGAPFLHTRSCWTESPAKAFFWNRIMVNDGSHAIELYYFFHVKLHHRVGLRFANGKGPAQRSLRFPCLSKDGRSRQENWKPQMLSSRFWFSSPKISWGRTPKKNTILNWIKWHQSVFGHRHSHTWLTHEFAAASWNNVEHVAAGFA